MKKWMKIINILMQKSNEINEYLTDKSIKMDEYKLKESEFKL